MSKPLDLLAARIFLRDCEGKLLTDIDHTRLWRLVHDAVNELECARGDRELFAKMADDWRARADEYGLQLEDQFRRQVRAAMRHPLYPERAAPQEEDVA